MTATVEQRALVAPAHLHRPSRAGSMVAEVTRVCASVGRILDEEQQLAVDVLTGMKPDGTPASLEAAVISARQNLKTYVLEGIALTLLLDPRNSIRLGIWSAQEFDTAQETFNHFDEMFDSDDYPHMSRRVHDIKRGSGKEEIQLRIPVERGGKKYTEIRRLKFKARSGKGGRGLTGDFVVLDEAFALDPMHMGALLPTLSTRRRAMVFYGSSAGKADSAVLRKVRDRGRKGGRRAPAYIEWCAPGSLLEPGCEPECQHVPETPGCVLDREDFWLMANPAMGRRITAGYLREERDALAAEEFARERLGWWDAPDTAEVPIALDDWKATALTLDEDQRSRLGRPVFFLDVEPGQTSATIAVAAMLDGRPHVELAAQRVGTRWLPARAAELKDHPDALFAAEALGAVGSMSAELERLDVEVELLSGTDMGRACGHLQGLAKDAADEPAAARRFTHSDDPRLLQAFAGAARREIGEGLWAWGRRKSTTNISPLVAATGALWLLEQNDEYDVADSIS